MNKWMGWTIGLIVWTGLLNQAWSSNLNNHKNSQHVEPSHTVQDSQKHPRFKHKTRKIGHQEIQAVKQRIVQGDLYFHEKHQPHHHPKRHKGNRHHRTHKDHGMVGLKMGWLSSFADEHGHISNHNMAAIGGFVEFVLISHHLELELEMEAVFNDEKLLLPIDVILKVPFFVHKTYELYVGLGVTFAPTLVVFSQEKEDEKAGDREGDEASSTHPSAFEIGMMAVVGTKIWFNETWGMEIEGSYHLVFEAGIPIHVAGVQTGVLAKW